MQKGRTTSPDFASSTMESEASWSTWQAEPSPPEPFIHGRANEHVRTLPNQTTNQNINEQAATGEDERGDLSIQGFWTANADCILDVHVTDTDVKCHSPFKVPELQEKEKKRKRLGACLQSCHHFTPFALSVDGLLGRRAETLAKLLAVELAEKWQKPCLQARGCVKARLSTPAPAASCATHSCLRGSTVPARNVSARFLQWEEEGAGSAMHEWT
jgi:predicted alpha/beta-fold hydrolase